MDDKEVKQKGDELLVLIEKGLIERVKWYFKEAQNIDMPEKSAKVILAKIGKKLLLELNS